MKGKLKLFHNQSYETIARVLAKNLKGEIFHCFVPNFVKTLTIAVISVAIWMAEVCVLGIVGEVVFCYID